MSPSDLDKKNTFDYQTVPSIGMNKVDCYSESTSSESLPIAGRVKWADDNKVSIGEHPCDKRDLAWEAILSRLPLHQRRMARVPVEGPHVGITPKSPDDEFFIQGSISALYIMTCTRRPNVFVTGSSSYRFLSNGLFRAT